MSDLKKLYQKTILEHNRNPRNYGMYSGVTHKAFVCNPICGDEITFGAVVVKGELQHVCFEGSGCAICKASASLFLSAIRHQTTSRARQIACAYTRALAGEEVELPPPLQVLLAVRSYPSRINCATMVCDAVEKALQEDP